MPRNSWPARDGRPRQAKTYCIVTSGLRPSGRDLDAVLGAVARIKAEYGLKICVSLGLLTPEQAAAAEGRRRGPREP